MINLLPYEAKRQIRAGRMNVLLVRYIVILGSAMIFLALACMTTYYLLNMNKTVETSTPKTTTPIIQNQSNTFSSDLATARNILDQQVGYGDIITGIAAALPSGAIINSLSLNDSSFGTPTDLKVYASSTNIEPRLKENFQKLSQFSNYTLLDVTNDNSGPTGYPVTINLKITINKGINQ